jgi:hypothetical protein
VGAITKNGRGEDRELDGKENLWFNSREETGRMAVDGRQEWQLGIVKYSLTAIYIHEPLL